MDANSVSRWLTQGGVGSVTSQDNTLFIQLMKNAKVRDWFLRRMGKLLATTLSAENVKACFTEQGKAIYEEMQRTCERWGWSFSSWQKNMNKVLKFAEERPVKLMGYFQKAFKLSDAEMWDYFGEAIEKAQQG